MNHNEGMWRDHRDELFDRVVRGGRARKRRRAFAVSVTLLALVLALAGGLYLPGRNSHSLRVANIDHGTTTTLPPARASGVLLIGDSVMLGAKSALEGAIPGARVDAAVSRQFFHAIAILDAAKRKGALPGTIVIGLGTNGPSEGDVFDKITAELKTIMETAGPESEVYFVTVKVPRPWEGNVNSGLYSEVALFPNAHVLAWHDFSRSHSNWFFADGIHLTPAGQTAYAAFIRDGIRSPATTFTDPFAGGAVPASGLVLTDDPKAGADPGPTSFSIALFDNSGNELGPIPRATIPDSVLSSEHHKLVVTDTGIHLEALPFDAPGDLPSGCMPTEKDDALAVALCGPGSGINLLGKRILVDNGSGWTQLIALPPVPAGATQITGHWAWASPSPDGRWVAAGWSAECEVPIGFLVSVADSSLHAVTGEAGTAWGDAPDSGIIGWAPDGSAMGVFGGGDTGCGTPASVPRGIYLVSPDTGSRRLLLALTPSQGVFTWSAVDDRRTPPA